MGNNLRLASGHTRREGREEAERVKQRKEMQVNNRECHREEGQERLKERQRLNVSLLNIISALQKCTVLPQVSQKYLVSFIKLVIISCETKSLCT